MSFGGSSSVTSLGLSHKLTLMQSDIVLDPRIILNKSVPRINTISSHLRLKIFSRPATSLTDCARNRRSSTTSSGRFRTTWCLSLRPKTMKSMATSLSAKCSASINIITNHWEHLGKNNNRYYNNTSQPRPSKS